MGALITYHRTDSNKMKDSEVKKLREFIKKDYGEKLVSRKVKFFTKKGQNLFNRVMKL